MCCKLTHLVAPAREAIIAIAHEAIGSDVRCGSVADRQRSIIAAAGRRHGLTVDETIDLHAIVEAGAEAVVGALLELVVMVRDVGVATAERQAGAPVQ